MAASNETEIPAGSPFQSPPLNEAIRKSAMVKAFKKGAVILQEDSFIHSIPVVLSGTLKVAKHDMDGNELVMYYIRPGESCVMSFLGGLHHEQSKVHAEVMEDAELLLIPSDKTAEWLKKYPEWTDYFLHLYHKRFQELLNVVQIMAFENTEARIMRLLAQKSILTGSRVIYTTHEQLAGELATSRVVVSRLLKKMEKEKVLLLGRGYIRLLAKM